MSRRRVVVTGMATINPLGASLEEFWERSVGGASGVAPIGDFAIPAHMSQMAGQVTGIDAAQAARLLDDVEEVETLDRSLLFALLATRSALSDAGLGYGRLHDVGPERCAVYLSTAIAQIGRMEQAFCRQSDGGRKPIRPARASRGGRNSFLFNTTSAELARVFGLQGGALTIATGCTGGVDALGYSLQAIRDGQVDIAVTGATEAPITPLVVAAFSKIRATSVRNHEPERASRPFDRQRDGFVLAEGCGILVLEELEHALRRGAPIYAEISGFSSVNNYYHMTDIPADGGSIARSCLGALADAGVPAEAIDFINAHGSSTPQNDIAEANAFQQVFGERAARIPVTSIKSQTGHSLSAANSIEIISSIMTLRHGIIPPTINLEEQDPLCPLDVVANTARQAPVSHVMKVSSGFSGIHSSLIIERYDERR